MFDINTMLKFDDRFGPIQFVHDFQFVPLNVNDDYSFIKNLNTEEKIKYMSERLKELKRRGYGGVVLNTDFENYLRDDEPIRTLDSVIDVAKSLGLRVWLYDEQYYPSGSAGGLVLENRPELEGCGLVCVSKDVSPSDAAVRIPSPLGHSELKYAFAVPYENKKLNYDKKINISEYKDVGGGLCWNVNSGEWRVYCYFMRALYEMTYLAFSFRASRRYPNIADKEAVERFADITYTKYDSILETPLGSRIEAVFTDEPSIMFYLKYPEGRDPSKATKYSSISVYDFPDNRIPPYPYVPWGRNFETEFLKMYGFDIVQYLPELFDETTQTRDIRIKFYKMIDVLVNDAYIGTLRENVHKRRMLLSGHYLREECFNRHPFMYGDILKQLGGMDIPGCDVLFSAPDMLRYSSACRLAASAAHLYGRPHVMIEASNMLDENQSLSLRELKAAISIMFVNGVDTITSYYGENMLSAEEMTDFAHYVSRLGTVFNGSKYTTDTLLYYPFEQLCAARIPDGPEFSEETMLDTFDVNGAVAGLMKHGISFDIINSEKLKACRIINGKLMTDYGETIKNIVFPKIDFVCDDIASVLLEFKNAGVNIFFSGKERAVNSLDCEVQFTENYDNIITDGLRFETYTPYVTCMHRRKDGCDMYMLANTYDKKVFCEVNIPSKHQDVKIVNPDTGEIIAPDTYKLCGRTKFGISLGGLESVIVINADFD